MIEFAIGPHRLFCGDNLEVLPTLEAASVSACVTDPPYGLSFMGRKWDASVPRVPTWEAVARILKPGAHLASFFGTRTYHRGAVEIEDAGFEIRDQLAWVYGSGFPKSLDVSKAIDKAAGAEREVIGMRQIAQPDSDTWGTPNANSSGRNQAGVMRADAEGGIGHAGNTVAGCRPVTAPATDAARQWNGWGTALKPAWEPIVLARVPFKGTVAANVLEHGTGAINVDGCRIEGEPTHGSDKADRANGTMGHFREQPSRGVPNKISTQGRWPANLIHDGSDEVLDVFPECDGAVSNGRKKGNGYSGGFPEMEQRPGRADSGSAARFFYCAKASRSDRGEGNDHETVKPTALMRWLCRLIVPPGEKLVDPFMGSGSTGVAAILEGFTFIGIEQDTKHFETACRRIKAAHEEHLAELERRANTPVQQSLFA